MKPRATAVSVVVWLAVAAYYFFQYELPSAPSVMIPQLTKDFGVNALEISATVGMFFYSYSPAGSE